MERTIQLKLTETEANLTLKAIESLQQSMVTGFDDDNDPKIPVSEIRSWEMLDDVWLRIFEEGLDAGFDSPIGMSPGNAHWRARDGHGEGK